MWKPSLIIYTIHKSVKKKQENVYFWRPEKVKKKKKRCKWPKKKFRGLVGSDWKRLWINLRLVNLFQIERSLLFFYVSAVFVCVAGNKRRRIDGQFIQFKFGDLISLGLAVGLLSACHPSLTFNTSRLLVWPTRGHTNHGAIISVSYFPLCALRRPSKAFFFHLFLRFLRFLCVCVFCFFIFSVLSVSDSARIVSDVYERP